MPGDDGAVDAMRALLGGDPAEITRSTATPATLREDMQIEVVPFQVSGGR